MMYWYFFFEDKTKRTEAQNMALEQLENKHNIILNYTNEYGRLICIEERRDMRVQSASISQSGEDVYWEVNGIYVITPDGDILPGGIIL